MNFSFFISTKASNTRIKKSTSVFRITDFLFEITKITIDNDSSIRSERKSNRIRPTSFDKRHLFVRRRISVPRRAISPICPTYPVSTRNLNRLIFVVLIFLSLLRRIPYPTNESSCTDFLLNKTKDFSRSISFFPFFPHRCFEQTFEFLHLNMMNKCK